MYNVQKRFNILLTVTKIAAFTEISWLLAPVSLTLRNQQLETERQLCPG